MASSLVTFRIPRTYLIGCLLTFGAWASATSALNHAHPSVPIALASQLPMLLTPMGFKLGRQAAERGQNSHVGVWLITVAGLFYVALDIVLRTR